MYVKTIHPESPRPETLPEYVLAAQKLDKEMGNLFTVWLKKFFAPADKNRH